LSRTTTPAAIRAAVLDAALAATASDANRFSDAVHALAQLDDAQLSLVQAATVRHLVEVLHPDGVTGEDVQQLLTDTARQAGAWWPQLDPDALVAVLVNSLGVADPDQPGPRPAELAAHAVLILAELAGRQPEPLAALVDQSLAEIRRAETMEMP